MSKSKKIKNKKLSHFKNSMEANRMQVMLFDYYTGVKTEPSNLCIGMMYSIVEFKMKVLYEECYHQGEEVL